MNTKIKCAGILMAWVLAASASIKAAPPGTAFTYQGQLKQGGVLPPGVQNVYFEFSLWDAAGTGNPPTGGIQKGYTIPLNVQVRNGLFTVPLNEGDEFGPDAFNGEARYLQIAMVFPAGGQLVTLSPRQPLTPTPYAFALPGLYTQQNADSPNIIGGHHNNSVDQGVFAATISGGGTEFAPNKVGGTFGTVGGGVSTRALGEQSTVGGGNGNTASGTTSTIAGGAGNNAAGEQATISGGEANNAFAFASTIGGGNGNQAAGDASTIGGGISNSASASFATIAGGGPTDRNDPQNTNNRIYDDYGTIGGGGGNRAGSETDPPGDPSIYATVGGGNSNTASGPSAVVAGGAGNTASGIVASIGGGYANNNSGWEGTIAGGAVNTASNRRATVGGGAHNTASGYTSTVCGGSHNTASGQFCTVGGGEENYVFDDYGAIGGGGGNVAGSNDANQANVPYATVAGGQYNMAGGYAANVAGGQLNVASGGASMVPGGVYNVAGGSFSFAGGYGAKVRDSVETSDLNGDEGTFIWADAAFPGEDLRSTGPNQFIVRAARGMYLGQNSNVSIPAGTFINTSTGAYLTTGGVWTDASDRNAKENFEPLDSRAVLDRLSGVPITRWNFRTQDDSIQHIGPMAQDFHAAFGTGQDDRHLAPLDSAGVALSAIQGLYEMVQEKDCEVSELRERKAELESRLAAVEEMMAKLMEGSNGGAR